MGEGRDGAVPRRRRVQEVERVRRNGSESVTATPRQPLLSLQSRPPKGCVRRLRRHPHRRHGAAKPHGIALAQPTPRTETFPAVSGSIFVRELVAVRADDDAHAHSSSLAFAEFTGERRGEEGEGSEAIEHAVTTITAGARASTLVFVRGLNDDSRTLGRRWTQRPPHQTTSLVLHEAELIAADVPRGHHLVQELPRSLPRRHEGRPRQVHQPQVGSALQQQPLRPRHRQVPVVVPQLHDLQSGRVLRVLLLGIS